MSHELFRITAKLYQSPQLMDVATFDAVTSFLDGRNKGIFTDKIDMAVLDSKKDRHRPAVYNSDTKVGVIKITDALTYLSYEPECGEASTSYQGIKANFEELVNKGAKLVVLDVDSGGGEAYQAFETAQYMRQLADEKDIKIVTYNDGVMASAAYALGCIADEVVVNPEAVTGSIGVLTRLLDTKEYKEKLGVKDVFIYKGASKIPYNPDGSFSEGYLGDVQASVDAVYQTFVNHVATMRGLPTSNIEDTEAKVFRADDAINLGLVDKKMTHLEFQTYVAEVAENINGENMSLNLFSNKTETNNKGEAQEMAQVEQLQTALASKDVLITDLTTKLSEATSTLATMQAQLTDLQKSQAEAKANTRKEKLSAVVSADKLEGMLAATASLDDSAFNTVLSSLSTQKNLEANKEMFEETSSTGVSIETKSEDADKALQVDLNAYTSKLMNQNQGV